MALIGTAIPMVILAYFLNNAVIDVLSTNLKALGCVALCISLLLYLAKKSEDTEHIFIRIYFKTAIFAYAVIGLGYVVNMLVYFA